VLVDANVRLEDERQLLTREIADERVAKDELKNEKADLIQAKESLEAEKDALSKTVTRASVIDAGNVILEGMKEKGSDKLKPQKRANNVEFLQICFDAEPNDVAKTGPENFFIRLIDPSGNTLFNEAVGSGILVDKSSKEEISYSQYLTVDYNQSGQRTCARWRHESVYDPGIYVVEVYNKGYLCGLGELLLK
jgi:cell division protein ZapB